MSLPFVYLSGNQCLLEYDETWKALIEHYKEKQCIVEGRNFPKHF